MYLKAFFGKNKGIISHNRVDPAQDIMNNLSFFKEYHELLNSTVFNQRN